MVKKQNSTEDVLKILLAFIQPLMNWASSHLIEKSSEELHKMKTYIDRREREQGSYTCKKGIGCGKVTFHYGMAWVYQADYLTCADWMGF